MGNLGIHKYLLDNGIAVTHQTLETFDKLDSLLNKLDDGSTPINNPKKNILQLLEDYNNLCTTEFNPNVLHGYRGCMSPFSEFVDYLFIASRPFQDYYALGQFYSFLNKVVSKASVSDPFYSFEIGEEKIAVPANNAMNIKQLCLTIGQEVDFAYKKDKSDVIIPYLSALESLFDNPGMARFDEMIAISIYMAGHIRYLQYDINAFNKRINMLKDIQKSFSLIGTE